MIKNERKNVNKLQNQYRDLLLPGVAKVVTWGVFTRSEEENSNSV